MPRTLYKFQAPVLRESIYGVFVEYNEKKAKNGLGGYLHNFIQQNASGALQITVCGTNEALIEGCIGILEYMDGAIRLSSGKGSVRFSGSKLRIRCLNPNSAMISGIIECIEFLK